jgi:hypothetical protein
MGYSWNFGTAMELFVFQYWIIVNTTWNVQCHKPQYSIYYMYQLRDFTLQLIAKDLYT